MNPLYQMMMSNNNNLLSKFQQFKNSFRGDPRQQVEQLLRSGRVSQEQYNQAIQQVKSLLGNNQNLPF